MKTLDLEKIHTALKAFAQERDWDQFHSVKNLSMALSVEASELAEIFQWMKEEDSNQLAQNPEAFFHAEEEIADVFLYLLRIAGKLDIDLEAAALKKMKKNALKYPVETSRGSAKKHSTP